MIIQVITIAIGVVLGCAAYELTKEFLLKVPGVIKTFYRKKIKRPIRTFKRRRTEKKRIKLQKEQKEKLALAHQAEAFLKATK